MGSSEKSQFLRKEVRYLPCWVGKWAVSASGVPLDAEVKELTNSDLCVPAFTQGFLQSCSGNLRFCQVPTISPTTGIPDVYFTWCRLFFIYELHLCFI